MLLKILVIIVAIGAVAIAFRSWGRKQGPPARQDPPPPPDRKAHPDAAETMRCRVCDAFVPVGSKAACARPDCPFGEKPFG